MDHLRNRVVAAVEMEDCGEIRRALAESRDVRDVLDWRSLRAPLLRAKDASLLLETLLESHSDLLRAMAPRGEAKTALQLAVATGLLDYEDLRRRLWPDLRDESPLLSLGARFIVKHENILGAHGFSIDARNDVGECLLFQATGSRDLKEMRFLLTNGASADRETVRNGCTSLHVACYYGNLDMVQLLWDFGATTSRHIVGRPGMTPFLITCQENHISIVKFFLEKNNLFKDDVDRLGRTALYLALERQHFELANYLLDRGANATMACEDGVTPLHLACCSSSGLARRMLDASRARTRTRGYTPLSFCCYFGFYDLVVLFLDDYAVPFTHDLITLACQGGQTNILKLLLDRGALLTEADPHSGFYPIHVACLGNKSADCLQIILEQNPNLRHQRTLIDGYTPLYVAAFHNNHNAASQLLALDKTLVHDADNSGQTPLYPACHNGHVHLLQILINYGADVDTTAASGLRPHQILRLQDPLLIDDFFKKQQEENRSTSRRHLFYSDDKALHDGGHHQTDELRRHTSTTST